MICYSPSQIHFMRLPISPIPSTVDIHAEADNHAEASKSQKMNFRHVIIILPLDCDEGIAGNKIEPT